MNNNLFMMYENITRDYANENGLKIWNLLITMIKEVMCWIAKSEVIKS